MELREESRIERRRLSSNRPCDMRNVKVTKDDVETARKMFLGGLPLLPWLCRRSARRCPIHTTTTTYHYYQYYYNHCNYYYNYNYNNIDSLQHTVEFDTTQTECPRLRIIFVSHSQTQVSVRTTMRMRYEKFFERTT